MSARTLGVIPFQLGPRPNSCVIPTKKESRPSFEVGQIHGIEASLILDLLLVRPRQDANVSGGGDPMPEDDRHSASSRRRSLIGSKRCARSGSNPNQSRSPISAG
jgi:hypothetical protein